MAANAIAFPARRAVLVTEPALSVLSDEELVGVLVHEYAHVNEPRRVVLQRITTSLLYLPLFLTMPFIKTWGLTPLLLALLLAILGGRWRKHMSLAMEKRADAAATSHESDAGTYARALERLYEFNLLPAKLADRNAITHPHLYDRLIDAGVPPKYPPPPPPPRYRFLLAFVAGALIVVFAGPFLEYGVARLLAGVKVAPHLDE